MWHGSTAGGPSLFGAAAKLYTKWLSVPASDVVKARLGCALAELHTGWAPHDVYERAEKDLTEARIWTDLGRLDTAEQFVTAAVHTYGGAHRRDGAMADLILAELHVTAGDARELARLARTVAAGGPQRAG